MANFLSTSLKNLFISLGASKTSDNNYAVPLLNATTKEPAGDMTISQLASVLGGTKILISQNSDINDFTKQGVVYISGSGSLSTSLANRPNDLVEAFILFAPVPTTQILITTWATFRMFKRSYDNGWKKWQRIVGTEVEYA